LISHNRLLWLCFVTFVYTAVTLYSIHGDLPSANNHRKDDWQQPIVVQQWHFNYAETEQILAKIKLNSRGELLLNSGLAKILTKAIESLPENMNDKALQRLAFLVSKGLPDQDTAAGAKLPILLINYYQLHYAEKEQLKTTAKLTTFQEKFLDKVELQNHYLGKDVATQFFGKQRSITRYLLERREIRLKTNKKRESIDA